MLRPATAVGSTPNLTSVRRAVAVLVFIFAVVLTAQSVAKEELPVIAMLLMMMAVALYLNRGGRFLRDWGLVVLGFVTYVLAARAVPDLGLKVHYAPQIEAERVLTLGSLPTNWLQSHLYDGTTGALEVISILLYASHFFAPLILAFFLWTVWSGRGFAELFFGILTVSLLGDITFLLAPTAPPWMASDAGLIPQVHHVIKNGLYDIGLEQLAAGKNNPESYNVVAAIPSLHIAWPVIGLLVMRKHRLPRLALVLQAMLIGGVLFAIVYTGEHYVVDALVGAVYAFVGFWLVEKALTTRRERGTRTAARWIRVGRRLQSED
jgi:hypothetical protein